MSMHTPERLLPGAEIAHEHIRRQLLDDYPDLDDETLRDTLEGFSNLPEVLSAIIRSALDDEALIDGLSTRLAAMKDRLDRLRRRAQNKRQLVRDAMVDGDLIKLTEPDFTVSLKSGPPRLEIQSEDRIPIDFWTPQPPKLDKQGLLAAVRSGLEIKGVSLVAPQPQLMVRTK